MANELRRLARLHGVQPEYVDNDGTVQPAAEESLRSVLRLLDARKDGPDAVEARRRELWSGVLPPVLTAWDGRVDVRLRFPAEASGHLRVTIELENGRLEEWQGRIEELPVVRRRTIGGDDFVARRLLLPFPLPAGYHRATVADPESTHEAVVLSAPKQAFTDDHWNDRRRWGAFLPLYALHRERSWGAGDGTDLEALVEWVADRGGSMVATLPLLATQWELNHDASPYAPTSRLFWNEFYVDVTRVPEFATCEAARKLVRSEEFTSELNRLRESETVDYATQAKLQRQVLQLLAEEFFERASEPRRQEFVAFRNAHPQAERFAQFRAVSERQGTSWTQWPERLQRGGIEPGDCDEKTLQYHLYTQWQIDQQLGHLSEHAARREMVWYLDLPLGVRGDGFDIWENQDLFARGAAGGAPPDAFFTGGQNWGFPPLNPRTLRETGYEYVIASLRHHFRYAKLLRIDHVMGLHRLYWIPPHASAKEGVYVKYRAQEWFAILSIESHRHQATVVGENLGTVPPAIHNAMRDHGVPGMYVLQFGIDADAEETFRAPPENAICSLNTHDLPPFAAFWQGLDVDDHLDLGLLDEQEAEQARRDREWMRGAVRAYLRRLGLLDEGEEDVLDVLRASLAWMGSTDVPFVLASLEDLWGETLPQNTPGTLHERPNWQRRTRLSFEEFTHDPRVNAILDVLNQRRRLPVAAWMRPRG